MEHLTEERRKIAKEIGNRLISKFKQGVREIWLYGSVARGDDGIFSDIDIRCLTKPHSFLAKGYEDLRVREEAYLLTNEAKKEGNKVVIEFQRHDEFYKLLEEAKKTKKPDKGLLWIMNIVNEGLLIYSS